VSARKIGLLILILGFGASIETAWSVRNHLDIGPSGCRVLGGKFYGSSYRFEEETTRAAAADARIELTNAFGTVHVRAGKANEVRIGLAKVVYMPTEDKAREFAAGIKIRAEEMGSGLRLSTNRDELTRRADDVGFETHFTVDVPPGASVIVKNDHGEVDVQDIARTEIDSSFDGVHVERIAGDANVKSRHGDVVVSEVKGTLDLTSRHGSVEVKDVKGKATIDSEHGDVTVEKAGGLLVAVAQGTLKVTGIAGDLDAKGSHGEVKVAGVTGAARVSSSFGSLTVSDVGGDVRLKVEHGELEATDVKGKLDGEASFDHVKLERIGGPVVVSVEHGGFTGHEIAKGVRAKVSGDEVELEAFQGPIEIEVERGAVTLRPKSAITDSVSVKTSNGGIRLDVPGASRFDLEARVRRGEIDVNVAGFNATETSPQLVKGMLGAGGPAVRLHAEGGDVNVEGASVQASKEN
jgi:Putative adhesin